MRLRRTVVLVGVFARTHWAGKTGLSRMHLYRRARTLKDRNGSELVQDLDGFVHQLDEVRLCSPNGPQWRDQVSETAPTIKGLALKQGMQGKTR